MILNEVEEVVEVYFIEFIEVVHCSSLRVDEVVEALTQATCADAHHEEADELGGVVDNHRTTLPHRGRTLHYWEGKSPSIAST